MKYITEGLSTYVFLSIGFLAMSYGINYYGALGGAIVFGFTFGFLFLLMNKKSRIYLNPIILFFDVLNKKISVKDFWLYFLVEFVGSLLAAATVLGLLFAIENGNDYVLAASWVCSFGNFTSMNLTTFGAIIFEIIFAFIFVVSFVVIRRRCVTTKTAAFYLGLVTGAFILFSYGITFTGANPVKAFGPSVVYLFVGETTLIFQFLVLCVADFIGALIAYAVLKKTLFKTKK